MRWRSDVLGLDGESLGRQAGRPYQAAQSSFGDLLVIGDRKRGDMVGFDQDDVAAAPSRDTPAELLEYLNDLGPAEDGQDRHQAATSI
jgi:hypothetical protein